jgi:gustatory receptor
MYRFFLGEHLLAKYTVICVVALCSDTGADLIKLYYLMDYRYVFEFVHFSPPVAALCEIVNFFASFYWNFIDLFVIVLSMALSSRFRLLNSCLRLALGKVGIFVYLITIFVISLAALGYEAKVGRWE